MAAPTNVRVEALSISSTVIRWTLNGSNVVQIYRSTDGSSYSIIGNAGTTATTSYTDTGLSTGTKYWYKLSDDTGATFSSVVTVYTMNCGAPVGNPDQALPTVTETPTADDFNALSQYTEERLTVYRSADGRTCVACVVDGAVVIDCIAYDNCDQIDVVADADINSISMPNCDDADKQVNFIVPPNTSGRKICGFPRSLGFTGDECFQAPITTGSDGKVMSTGTRGGSNPQSKSGVQGGGSRGGGSGSGGGGSCTCVPGTANQLTIKSCNANNSLKCSTTKSLRLIVCGGRGPYTWSKTGSVTVQSGENGTPGSTSTGATTIVKPPTNSGSGVAGDAVKLTCWECLDCPSPTCGAGRESGTNIILKCDDSVSQCGAIVAGCTPAPSVSTLTCHNGAGAANECGGTPPNASCGLGAICAGPTSWNGCGSLQQTVCDIRTAPMISAGCSPCSLNAGATVTVTDALGTSVTITLKA